MNFSQDIKVPPEFTNIFICKPNQIKGHNNNKYNNSNDDKNVNTGFDLINLFFLLETFGKGI